MTVNYYEKMGVRPFIDCQDNNSAVGGARFQVVEEAMNAAEQQFVNIPELLDKSGAYIAQLLGVEAAYVTPSCTAALQYSIAGVMTGRDSKRTQQLPDTTGMKSELVIQRYQAFWTLGCQRPTGVKIVLAGNDDGYTAAQLETLPDPYIPPDDYECTVAQLEAAIGPNTAAVGIVPGHFHEREIPLEETVRIAHTHGLPVIADAASQCFPLEYQRQMAHCADLVCFGGKYIGGPNDTGFICGKRELVEQAAAHGFLSYQNGHVPFGRGMKLDRTQIVGLVAALENWLTMDHSQRLRETDRKRQVIADAVSNLPHVTPKPVDVKRNGVLQSMWLEIEIDPQALGKTAYQVFDELNAGDPRVLIGASGHDVLRVVQQMLLDGEEYIAAEKLRQSLKTQ
jgi:L-seryl-tRNA(Ser) seleniumtransferase